MPGYDVHKALYQNCEIHDLWVRSSGFRENNVRGTATCTECMKSRCIYAKSKLTTREERSLKHTLENIDYTCGSLITPNGDILQGKVFVRLQMSCQSPIEFPYYSSTVGRVDVCAHCTLPSEKSQEMLKKYKVVLPVCAQCLISGKEIPKRNPVK
ncbi:uncharacterized protein [Magallana gigas]|uniref:uncharacterized protein n=1 Tax=Magallana gigas TaxID=29159 RepID=UPI003342C623